MRLKLSHHNASLTLRKGEGRNVGCKYPWLPGSLKNVWQGCQVVLKPEFDVRGPVAPTYPSIRFALVSLATINWLFSVSSTVDIFWCLITCDIKIFALVAHSHMSIPVSVFQTSLSLIFQPFFFCDLTRWSGHYLLPRNLCPHNLGHFSFHRRTHLSFPQVPNT